VQSEGPSIAPLVDIDYQLFVPSLPSGSVTGSFGSAVIIDDTTPTPSPSTLAIAPSPSPATTTRIVDMWPGSIVHITYEVDVAANAVPGIDVITLTAQGTITDTTPSIVNQPELDVASESTSITAALDLYVYVGGLPSRVVAGSSVPAQFNVTVGNRGPADATNAHFSVHYVLPDFATRVAQPVLINQNGPGKQRNTRGE
jgi:hypothetical protein